MKSTTSKKPTILPSATHDDNTKNPIILPTTTHDDNIVRDVDDNPLKTGENYIIHDPNIRSNLVYWGNIGNTPCPNSVLQYNSAQGNVGDVTAVKFFYLPATTDDVVCVDSDINITFSVDPSNKCAHENVWKVDKKNYVVTGGSFGSKSNVFKIQKNGSEIQGHENVYKLTYCPPHDDSCVDVSVVKDNENIRLSILPNGAQPFVFAKAKNA